MNSSRDFFMDFGSMGYEKLRCLVAAEVDTTDLSHTLRQCLSPEGSQLAVWCGAVAGSLTRLS